MKIVYGLNLEDVEHPLYVERAAQLLEKLAVELRKEAAGGVVISHVGHTITLDSGDSVTLLGYADKPSKLRPKPQLLVVPG